MPTTLQPYALTTRQKVKDYLSISDTTKDTLIDELINYVSYFIQNYCGGRNFLSQSYVEIKDPGGRTKLFLNQFPVTAVTLVEYRSGTPSTPVWVTYSADAYLPYLLEGYIHFYARLPLVPQGMRVTYTAGYLIDFTNEFSATHTLPEDLTMVCTEIVAKQVNTAQSQGIYSESTEGQSVQFDSKVHKLSDNHEEILNSYKTFRYAI